MLTHKPESFLARFFSETVYGQIPAPPASLMLRLLGLTSRPRDRSEVLRACRTRLLDVHPDTSPGTGLTTVDEVRWAREAALAAFELNAPETGDGYRFVTALSVDSDDESIRDSCSTCGDFLVALDAESRCVRCVRTAARDERRRRERATRRQRVCVRCGSNFQASRRDALYCTAACRQAAHRQRASTYESAGPRYDYAIRPHPERRIDERP